MDNQFKYDVFISYSKNDKEVAERLAKRLSGDSRKVYLTAQQLSPSEKDVAQALDQSRTLILIMSKDTFGKEWHTIERQTILFRDPSQSERRFAPVLIDDTLLIDSLKQFAYIDWRTEDPAEYKKLIAICTISEFTKNRSLNFIDSKLTKKTSLKGHTDDIQYCAMSLDGKIGATCALDDTVRIWDLDNGRIKHVFKLHTSVVWTVKVTADGKIAVSGSHDKTVRVWDIEKGECKRTFRKHKEKVTRLDITPDGKYCASGSDDGEILFWSIEDGKIIKRIQIDDSIWSIAISQDASFIAASNYKSLICWETETKKEIFHRELLNGSILGLVFSGDNSSCFIAQRDWNISKIDIRTGSLLARFEGHTERIWNLSLSADDQLLVSGSEDGTIRIWNTITGECIYVSETKGETIYGAAINSAYNRILVAPSDLTAYIWDFQETLTKSITNAPAKRYTNAKVLLVGDSGVGKSGLAIRLTEDCFRPTDSTDGVWATQLNLTYAKDQSDIEREIWLWDFAGQSDYRLIHQLFMDETSLAVLVFNPQAGNPFEGLGQWTQDLQKAARKKFKKLLVAGRCDRGGATVSRQSIDNFHTENSFSGYFVTSANTGEGCAELKKAILDTIDWEDIPWTSSPRIFHLLKTEIIKLKDEGKVLLRMSELKQQLEIRLQNESFTVDELNAVVRLLAGPGLVWKLEFGNFVLLEPERINAYAAAVIRRVRKHVDEIGVISEEDVLTGKLEYADMKRLAPEEEQIILRAMHQTFVDHSLCLREQTEAGNLLVFPSYFNRERPEQEKHPAILVSYRFKGNLDDIYSTLIVRLQHTSAFHKDQLWKFAANFKTPSNQVIGLKMIKLNEGSAEISIYFEPKISDDTKVTFIKYVHDHIKVKATDIKRIRHYVCPHCGTPVADHGTVAKKIAEGKKHILCLDCEKKIPLNDIIEEKFASEKIGLEVIRLEKTAQSSIDNESKELILVGHAFSIAGEAGQIFRPTPNSDWGIDGEIEFKNDKGEASGKRLYLQLKSGDSYLYKRKADGKEIFRIKKPRQAEYWTSQAYPVMLVIRTSNSEIRWMNVTDYLKKAESTNEIIFEGESFSVLNVLQMKDKVFA